MLDLYELQVFIVAAETQNFSETGRVMQISQPAVSGHIHALEERLKTRLFDRRGRTIKLNDVGEALVPVVRHLLKEAQTVEEFAASQQGHIGGLLTIGCSTAASRYMLPKLIGRFLAQHPEVRIVCESGPFGQALERLGQGKIDLVVSSLRVPQRAVEYCHFADDRLVLIAPPGHPWAQATRPLSIEELVEHPLIFHEPNSGTMITLNRELAVYDMGVEMLQSHLTMSNTEAIIQAVAEGIGPAFVSWTPAHRALEQGVVVEVPVEGLRPVQRLYMARHTGFRATEVQTAFWDFAFAPANQDLRQFFT